VQDAPVLHAAVAEWFRTEARDLPWRDPDRTPWGVLVSEIMLQQTPVVRVLPRWLAWMERWPAPADLADASPDDVLRAWDTLGYPRRALRLQACARAIVAEHDGRVPSDEEQLLALPGIGEYTAAAVACFAFGRRSVVVDTNVRRVEARAVTGAALPSPSYSAAERRLAAALVPDGTEESVVWNSGVMELGALVCTARAARCEACPLIDVCTWRAVGYPADEHAARRRVQGFEGTDRQVRGRVMALLRAAEEPVARVALAETRPDDPAQVERALAGLLSDGLVQEVGGRYRLPRTA
jgi:A/G-specific adenine glycosylase